MLAHAYERAENGGCPADEAPSELPSPHPHQRLQVGHTPPPRRHLMGAQAHTCWLIQRQGIDVGAALTAIEM